MKILTLFSFIFLTLFSFDSQVSADGHQGNLDEIGERIKRAVKSGEISEKEGWSKWHSVAREHGHDDNDEGWNEEGDEIERLHQEIELHELRFELDRIKERAVNSSAVSNRKGEAKRECLPCESKDEENNEIERLHREIEIRKLHFELDRIEHEHDLERKEWEHQFERMERDFDREHLEWDREQINRENQNRQTETQGKQRTLDRMTQPAPPKRFFHRPSQPQMGVYGKKYPSNSWRPNSFSSRNSLKGRNSTHSKNNLCPPFAECKNQNKKKGKSRSKEK